MNFKEKEEWISHCLESAEHSQKIISKMIVLDFANRIDIVKIIADYVFEYKSR